MSPNPNDVSGTIELHPVDHDPFGMPGGEVYPPAPAGRWNPVGDFLSSMQSDQDMSILGHRALEIARRSKGGAMSPEDERTMRAAVGMTMGMGTIGEGEAAAKGIRAFHGSPHDFERFDISKIGTGEGAQAYGHGLYFAESPKVAQQYKENLGVYPALNERTWNSDRTPNRAGQAAMELHVGISPEEIAQGFKVKEPNASPEQIQQWIDEGRGILDDVSKKAGRMYEVQINADPEHFLDWDKPLSEQHPQTQAALKQAMGSNWNEFRSADTKTAVNQGFIAPSAELAAQKLREAGIPGIKYLDQGSRAAGEGTRNYVVFDDKIIDIIKKYGLAGLSMLPPATAAFVSKRIQAVDHDPFSNDQSM